MMVLGIRRAGRTFRRELSILKYRLLHLLGTRAPAKVVPLPTRGSDLPLIHPAVGVIALPGMSNQHLRETLAHQTETSWTMEPDAIHTTPLLWCPGSSVEDLEASHLESLVLAAAALDINETIGGWAAPEGSTGRPTGFDQGTLTLVRRPCARASTGLIHGALIPQITQETPDIPVAPPTHQSGPFVLNHEGGPGAVVRVPVHDVYARLASLPTEAGPPTVLFVAPYLAIGGAENLLFDLIEGLAPEHRVLVVTLDPHQEELGQTVDRCRRLTPNVYTLGDWMPREARIDALRHLIRRWQVEVLVSWNGTVDFYDHALAIKQEFPELRVLAQLYNHEGGWMDRTTANLLSGLDGHLAVNGRISQALVDRGAPEDKVHTVHHGVPLPAPVSYEERFRRRQVKRRELKLPEEAIVVGTFIRVHAQKRPLDIVRLAQKFDGSQFHFLLVGGGPEAQALDAEIQHDPPNNLHRLPLQSDALHLYDALDICLLTSDYEGLPVFLLDGLAREIPCAATAVGEIPELLHDGGGILIDSPGDIDALANALLSLEDPARRRSEGERGRRTVEERFSLDTYVEAYRHLLFPGDCK